MIADGIYIHDEKPCMYIYRLTMDGRSQTGLVACASIDEYIENKIKNRTLIIPGKVAVLKGELEERLPEWTIVVAPNEATNLVKFLKELNA